MNFFSKSGLTMLLISFISLSLGMQKPITPLEQRIKRQITAITEFYNRKHNKNITDLICALATPKSRNYLYLFMNPQTINARTTQGQTALAIAARNNLTSEAALLIKNGSYINSQDNDGNTPLIKAAKRGNSEIVRLLLNYGASTEIKNHTNETAAQIAYAAGHRVLAALLITNSNTTVDLTAEKNDSKKDTETNDDIFIKFQISELTKKYNLNHNLKLTNLMCTTLLDGTKYMHHFIQDLNTQNAKGDTALLLAVRKNLLPQTRYLLQSNADISIKNNKGQTALTIAKEQGNEEIVTLLFNELDKQRRTQFLAYIKSNDIFLNSEPFNTNAAHNEESESNDEPTIVQQQSKKRKRTQPIYHDRKSPFPCPTCNKPYETPKQLKKHKRDVHSDNIPTCNDCSQTFLTRGQLNYHKKSIHIPQKTQNKFTCSQCTANFASQAKLELHFRFYHKQKPHECPNCKRSFSKEDNLTIHLQLSHSINETNSK